MRGRCVPIFEWRWHMGKKQRKTNGAPQGSQTASSNDSTGMMPTPPRSQAEMQAYRDLGNTIIPTDGKVRKKVK